MCTHSGFTLDNRELIPKWEDISCWKSRLKSVFMYTFKHIYKRHHLWTKFEKNAAIFCSVYSRPYFPGSFSDYDIATWGWFMLVLDTWFEYGTESRLLSDDWSIISLSSSSLQLSRSSSLLPGKPLTDEPFALVWIPLGWREGLEGS